jgi:cytochrome c oxidase subunit 4
MSAPHDPQTHALPPEQAGAHHVPFYVLVATLVALLALTFVTVAATWVNFGGTINVSIAIGIATIKAILVALYFMHLRYDKPFNAIVLICALLFVMLFVVATLQDSFEYRGNVDEYRQVDPTRYAPAMPTTESPPLPPPSH